MSIYKELFVRTFCKIMFYINANIAMKRRGGCKLMLGQLSCQAKELWSLILHIRTMENIMLRSCPKKIQQIKLNHCSKAVIELFHTRRGTPLCKSYRTGMVFVSFQSENGYRLCPFWSGISYGFRGNYASVWMYLSFQFQRNEKERVICKFEFDFEKSFCWNLILDLMT